MRQMYESLEAAIYGIAGGDAKKIRFYRELIAKHFEGVMAFDDLPDSLKIAVAEWENAYEERN